MLSIHCNQEKPDKNDGGAFYSEKLHYKRNPEYDKKRTTPYKNVPKMLY